MTRNRLSESASPYLLQHADNPVHWREWSKEAFAEARSRDVPVLLSVGYATCHWCHVMAHESFEDEGIASLMNQWFVNVKVDREERPDVDRIYMDAVQAMTGRGGWPMTVFLTPDGEPFFAGTYFPKADRAGHPGFSRILEAINDAWSHRRQEVESQAGQMAAAVAVPIPAADGVPQEGELARAYESIAATYDDRHGGFGGAPKFPQVPTLEFLLRCHGREWAPRALEMVTSTLLAMGRGGIHDLLGGGFARYSVDDHWLVPHFEKMLYDNALLGGMLANASLHVGGGELAALAAGTLDYVLRDLGLPEGGFASGEDADSEGHEGTFYVFDRQTVADAAGDLAPQVMRALGVTEQGNFEGRNILHWAASPAEVTAELGGSAAELEGAVAATLDALRKVRDGRPRPLRDDKVVTAWNGLAVRALAEAGIALDRPDYLAASGRTADFLLTTLRRDDGRLLRSWRHGRAGPTGFCDDYGALANGLFALYQATGDSRWFAEAARLVQEMIDLFWDDEGGGFFATGHDAEQLIARPKNQFDNPTPSDNALAAEAMQHMAAFTGDQSWDERVDAVLRNAGRVIERYPGAAGHHLAVAAARPVFEVAVVGTDRSEMLDVLHETHRPGVFVAQGTPEDGLQVPLLADRPMMGDATTAYVCRGFVCDAPTTDPEQLRVSLR